MKKKKLIICSILICLIFSLGFILTNYNEAHHSSNVNVVTESKEKGSQELEIVPIKIENNQDIDKHDKIKVEKETDEDMKKEFVEFDNEDVITTSNELPDAPVTGH